VDELLQQRGWYTEVPPAVLSSMIYLAGIAVAVCFGVSNVRLSLWIVGLLQLADDTVVLTLLSWIPVLILLILYGYVLTTH